MSAMTSAATPRTRRYRVSGAGSGIGLAVVRSLVQASHLVWAGARRTKDLARLAAIEGVTAVPLDLLEPADSLAAVETATSIGIGIGDTSNSPHALHSTVRACARMALVLFTTRASLPPRDDS